MDDLQKKLAAAYTTHPDLTKVAGLESLSARVGQAMDNFFEDLGNEVDKLISREFKGTSYKGTMFLGEGWGARWTLKMPRIFYDTHVDVVYTARDPFKEVSWVVSKATKGGGAVVRSGSLQAKNTPDRMAQTVFRSIQDAMKPSAR